MLDSGRSAHFDRAAYGAWLQKLRAVCSERDIVLIFDEVFVGFRLAPGGAQEYFGVRADMVTYGKTVAGGLPVGVLCGKPGFMRRYREERPADICSRARNVQFASLRDGRHVRIPASVSTPRTSAPCIAVSTPCGTGAPRHSMSGSAPRNSPYRSPTCRSIWTVLYTQPSRYNWMFQYYLRAAGLALSLVGTGRLIFSLNYTDADFAAVADRIVSAARAMQRDGWWWSEPL